MSHADAYPEPSGTAEPTETTDPVAWETGGEQYSDEELIDELTSHAAHLAIAECHYVLLVAELDHRDLWGNLGAPSCAHWLNWRCGTSIGTAREQVRVGRALANLPIVRGAFAAGEISYSKARAITRIATPKTERQLVEWARLATASQLELIVRSYRRVEANEGKRALARHGGRYVRTYTDDEGMIVIQARFSPEDGAVVLAAIEAARDAIRADSQGQPSQPSRRGRYPGPRRDSGQESAERGLGRFRGNVPRGRGRRLVADDPIPRRLGRERFRGNASGVGGRRARRRLGNVKGGRARGGVPLRTGPRAFRRWRQTAGQGDCSRRREGAREPGSGGLLLRGRGGGCVVSYGQTPGL